MWHRVAASIGPRLWWVSLVALLAATTGAACGGDDEGGPDSGAIDATSIDAGWPDSTPPDANPPDGQAPDSAGSDAGTPDAEAVDAASPDAVPVDAPTVDAPEIDAPPADAPPSDAPEPDAPPADALPPDAPLADADTTDAGPPPLGVTSIALGELHTCALLTTGAVRCWGHNTFGRLGYGHTNSIGDDETPASAGDVDVGGTVVQIAAGTYHTCALLDSGSVRCWGFGAAGQLGYGNTHNIGDDETPSTAGDVDVGGIAVQVVAGGDHTCALLDSGAVRCWGDAWFGQLGYGNTNNIGDNESPASAGDVNVGATVVQITAGSSHTCALLDTGSVRCWGNGGYGRLGYGNTSNIGDNETPASAGDVNIGGPVVQTAAGTGHTCALLDTGALRCWGRAIDGQLGYGNTAIIGDNEAPATAGDVNVGGTVVQVVGSQHTCARLATGAVRCWGPGDYGQLGYGNVADIGDSETPASAGDVAVGGTVVTLGQSPSALHTCAVLTTGAVRCWGAGSAGQLGYGNTTPIGDNELPSAAGDVPVL